ncbi:hypothetical protein PtrM4_027190 [Pyrenophora tritici-repentis]|uniref:Mg2+ transporter zinc transport protein n=1 Tax=Pyrenophora tritici-repentis TaxID=45151 RepID=A0A834S9T6_9PLEO|nr:hypothetical protein PtrM4_027190 [Pyrenophora tritici-repentis]KAI1517834.1 mg2+ transporter zinc transport protein [Pyrenophora tritici-repentis]KAI1689344.1 mg2+ transporter zinc transport protein [Pyrenophora tritici-repentis]
MEEDLKDILEKIDIWENRKADRNLEEPRWTRNDERRYRAAITKLTKRNALATRDLIYHLTTVRSLRVSFSNRLQSTRDELNFLNAENIRYFTYLNAVFLPLGFATGVWSMAESPPHGKNIKGMAATAVVTLLLTVTVIVNMQILKEQLSKCIFHRIWDNMGSSTLNIGETSHSQSVPGPSSAAGQRGNAPCTN